MTPKEHPGDLGKIDRLIERNFQNIEVIIRDAAQRAELTLKDKLSEHKKSIGSPVETISFAEAVQLLEGKLDLKAARDEAVKLHARWGLINELIEMGVIDNSDAYGSLFDQATMDKAAVLAACELREKGEKVTPVFDPGMIAIDRLLTAFKSYGMPTDEYTAQYKILNKLHKCRIYPFMVGNNIPEDYYYDPFKFNSVNYDKLLAMYSEIYELGDPLEPTEPCITLIPDEYKLRINTSSIAEQRFFVQGKTRSVEPIPCILFLRHKLDQALSEMAGGDEALNNMSQEAYQKLMAESFSDHSIFNHLKPYKHVRCSDHIFPNGSILNFSFFPSFGFQVSGSSPSAANTGIGDLIALGHK